MELKQYFYNSIGNNMPKNAIQFSLGVILYYLIFGIPNILVVLLAFVGFMLTYSSVYLFNDLMDIEEDLQHPEKLKWKFIANGSMSKEAAVSIFMLFVMIGLGISLLVGKWFAFIMVGLLVLNFLHSSSFTKFKRSKGKTAFNMTAIEFLKYSCGWFALTSNIASFPFWIVLSFAVAYNIGYIIYKFDFRGKSIKKNKVLFGGLGGIGILSYVMSIIIYKFPLALLMVFFLAAFVVVSIKFSGFNVHRMNNMMMLEYVLLPLIIVSFLSMGISQVSAVNDLIRGEIDQVRDNISENIPAEIKGPIEEVVMELERYQKAEDIECELTCIFS